MMVYPPARDADYDPNVPDRAYSRTPDCLRNPNRDDDAFACSMEHEPDCVCPNCGAEWYAHDGGYSQRQYACQTDTGDVLLTREPMSASGEMCYACIDEADDEDALVDFCSRENPQDMLRALFPDMGRVNESTCRRIWEALMREERAGGETTLWYDVMDAYVRLPYGAHDLRSAYKDFLLQRS